MSKRKKCPLKDKCGSCEFFDGDGLNERGQGMGECCHEPPVWLGPTDFTDVGELYNLLEDFWRQPMVGVASRKCSHYKQRKKRAWWYK